MIKSKILLAEDDESLGFVIKDNLEQAGFDVSLAKNGKQAKELFYTSTFDICLLDVMMPEMDGFTLGKEIRIINKQIPIIYLTAKSLEEDRILGFKIGADDYITKPFSIQELELRIKAILKRTNKSLVSEKDIFEIGNYSFDYKNLILKTDNFNKTLTKKEAELLRLLCIHKDSVLERETALKIVWGEDDYFLGRSMDVFITKLRKYLSQDDSIKIINVHGVGFKLTEN